MRILSLENALIFDRGGHAEHGGVADPRETAWIVRIGDAAGWAEHILKVRRQQPAWLDMGLVYQFQHLLTASHRARHAGKEPGVAIEGLVGVGNPHVGHPHPDPVERAAGHETDEADAAVEIEVDQVSIGRAIGDPAENRHARQRVRNAPLGYRGRPIKCLLEGREYSEVAAKLCRDAVSSGVGDRQGLRSKTLIVELSEMLPASRRKVAGERAAGNFDIVIPANLSDHPWRVVDAKRQTVIVAKLRVAFARPRRTAVENRAKGGDLLRQRGLDANAKCRDRRCRAPSRKVGGFDGWPAKRPVDEQIVGLAVEELDVGCLLADPYIESIIVETLLEIRVIEPRVGQRFGLADRREIMDVVARQSAAVNLVGIGEKPAPGPADQSIEIGIDREIKAAEMNEAARSPA